MLAGERKLAVLFADISGSTHLFEALGDVEAHRVVEVCLAVARAVTSDYGGRVVKGTGDGVLCTFPDGHAAIGAATDMQARLDTLRRGDTAIPPVRLGVAEGAVLEDGGDVFGETVNLAARLTALATAGQVLTNRSTAHAFPASLSACCRELFSIELKGISGKVDVNEVVWKRDAELTMVTAAHPIASSQRAAAPVLRLRHAGREVCVSRDRPEVRIGRDPQSDLVVTAPTTSRRHARIRIREDNVVVIDESANGTFVHFEARELVHLLHEETVLVGRGAISFGTATLDADVTATFVVDGGD